MSGEDETAYACLTRIIYLEQVDGAAVDWKQLVMLELDRMRAEMPFADHLELRLSCERRPLL